jgi:hypothetical protein
MPNIREESAPQGLGLNPTETGIDATLQSARRIGTFYNQTADLYGQEGGELKSAISDAGQVAVDYMDHREISAGAAHGAQFMAQKNSEWEDVAKHADPNDTTVGAKFIAENLEPALEQFQQGFNTEKSQAWAEHFVDQYRNHMFEKTTATMSDLAGEAVKVNVAKTINGLSSAVAVDPSTHSIDNAFSVLDHSVGAIVDSSPNISVETGAKIKGEVNQKAKEQIVKSAISSMIQKNPTIDLDAIQKKYGDYIKGDEIKTFQKAAQVQAKVDFLQNKQIEAYQDKQKEKAAGVDISKTLTDNVTFDTGGKVTINPKFFQSTLDVEKKYPGSATSDVKTMIGFGSALQQKTSEVVSDPGVIKDLDARMLDVNKPTTEFDLMKAVTNHQLSESDFSHRMQLVQSIKAAPFKDPVYKNAMDAAEAMFGNSQKGNEKAALFRQSIMPEIVKRYQANQLSAKDVDASDPNSLLMKTYKQFELTESEKAQAFFEKMARGAPVDMSNMPSLPGSTPKPTAPARKFGDITVPSALNGIAALQLSKDHTRWRDSTSGTIYDLKGNEIKQ